MLTTQFGGGLRARPLRARPDRDAGTIWFIIDVLGATDDEIGAAHDVGLVFVDARDRVYLSVLKAALYEVRRLCLLSHRRRLRAATASIQTQRSGLFASSGELMNTLRTLVLGVGPLFAVGALAQTGNMMGNNWGGGWMGSWMGGYGGVWLPILVVAVVAGVIVMIVRRK